MHFAYDHDRFVSKNRMLASAEDMLKKRGPTDRPGDAGARPQEKTCYNCRRRQRCAEFRATRTGTTRGVVSVGGRDHLPACEKYEPETERKRNLSDREIKSLMKNFKRSR